MDRSIQESSSARSRLPAFSGFLPTANHPPVLTGHKHKEETGKKSSNTNYTELRVG